MTAWAIAAVGLGVIVLGVAVAVIIIVLTSDDGSNDDAVSQTWMDDYWRDQRH